MDTLIEQQDGRCGRWFRRGTIRRLEVDIPRTASLSSTQRIAAPRPAGLADAGGRALCSCLGAAALACPGIGAVAGFLEPVGFALDGNDLGVVHQAVD